MSQLFIGFIAVSVSIPNRCLSHWEELNVIFKFLNWLVPYSLKLSNYPMNLSL